MKIMRIIVPVLLAISLVIPCAFSLAMAGDTTDVEILRGAMTCGHYNYTQVQMGPPSYEAASRTQHLVIIDVWRTCQQTGCGRQEGAVEFYMEGHTGRPDWCPLCRANPQDIVKK